MSKLWIFTLILIGIIMSGSLLTVFIFESWSNILLNIVVLIIISYFILFIIDKLSIDNISINSNSTDIEGFIDNDKINSDDKSESDANKSKYEWLTNDDLFDDFYASVFTKLTQNEKLIQAETAICMEEFSKNMPKDQQIILDAGCGIGIATTCFAKLGAGHTIGIDRSNAMVKYAKHTTIPSTTLTDIEKQNIEFRQGDLIGSLSANPAEFTHACLLYFTVYYFRDLDNIFRNLHLWVKPGGTLAIEVVNKYKFEPILDSANPWIGFSPQKYSKERITKSKVVFDKFNYEADFKLDDPKAEFSETFRFKDGSVRRQKHTLYMPSIQEVVQKAQNAGWTYTKYVDLMPVSFPYGYILFFTRNPE